MTTKEYLEARKSKNWKFNRVVSDNAFTSVNRIHPSKQKAAARIVEEAKKDSAVRRIIIFGSSTRYDCDITSDLDICIDWVDDCYDEEGVLKPFTRNMTDRPHHKRKFRCGELRIPGGNGSAQRSSGRRNGL